MTADANLPPEDLQAIQDSLSLEDKVRLGEPRLHARDQRSTRSLVATLSINVGILWGMAAMGFATLSSQLSPFPWSKPAPSGEDSMENQLLLVAATGLALTGLFLAGSGWNLLRGRSARPTIAAAGDEGIWIRTPGGSLSLAWSDVAQISAGPAAGSTLALTSAGLASLTPLQRVLQRARMIRIYLPMSVESLEALRLGYPAGPNQPLEQQA